MNKTTFDPKLEERLRPLDPPYEHEEQRQIGRLLDYHGVPFFYRQATLVYDQGKHEIWHPDFTLPTYDGLVIGYAAQANSVEARHKQQVYQANEIPAVLVYPPDLTDSQFSIKLFQMMYEAIREHVVYTRWLGNR